MGRKETKTTNSDEETVAAGREFARGLCAGDLVALFGELGSGKTTFVKGVGAGLNSSDDITSPTFTLINEYSGRLPIFHFDFYRVENSEEARNIGCEDYFYGNGVCLIEWAERVTDLLPANRIEVHFKNLYSVGNSNIRKITVFR